jgi:hypothetical protein
MRICFVGDSLVNGTGDPVGLGWVGRACAAARRRGHEVTCYNLGIRRDTSADIATVAELAGHESMDTTRRSDRRPEQAKKTAQTLLHVPYHKAKGTRLRKKRGRACLRTTLIYYSNRRISPLMVDPISDSGRLDSFDLPAS